MGRFTGKSRSIDAPSIVIPVVGLMDTMSPPSLLPNRQAEGRLDELAQSQEVFLPEVLSELRTDLHLFIHSDGGLMDMLKCYRLLIDSVRKGGGKVYSYVPHRAGSAAALLALDADLCFTTDHARFMFHSVAPAKLEDRWRVAPCDSSPFGVRIESDPLITPLPPTVADRASHDAWVDRILKGASHADRNRLGQMKRMLGIILKDPTNERGEFVVNGGTLSQLVSTVKPFDSIRNLRRHAEKQTSLSTHMTDSDVNTLWSDLRGFQS